MSPTITMVEVLSRRNGGNAGAFPLSPLTWTLQLKLFTITAHGEDRPGGLIPSRNDAKRPQLRSQCSRRLSCITLVYHQRLPALRKRLASAVKSSNSRSCKKWKSRARVTSTESHNARCLPRSKWFRYISTVPLPQAFIYSPASLSQLIPPLPPIPFRVSRISCSRAICASSAPPRWPHP